MKRSKFVILFSFLAVMVLATVGSGYGFFYLNNPEPGTQDAEARVDDIEENYALKDNNAKASYFDVYFFVQEQAANASDSLSYTPTFSTDSGYWENTDLAEGVQAQPLDYPQYGWRKLTVYRSISVEQFNTIGHPLTTATDRHGFTYDFSGWTANRQAAQNCITHRQGDFDYVDAFQSLTQLDKLDTDGSEAGDGIIFLYPIFTTGKDYTISDAAAMQPVVQFTDTQKTNTNTSFFAQEGSYNNSTYRYNNMTVTQSDIDSNRFGINVSELGLEGGWFSSYDSTGWSGGWGDAVKDSGNSLFSLPGTYNIAVKVFVNANNFGIYQSNYDSFLTSARNTYGTIDAFANSENAVVVNTIEWGFDGEDPSGFITQSGISDMLVYVLVERVYEFHLMGGPYGTFGYNEEGVRPFYDGDIYVADYTPSPAADGTFVTTYGLNDVYIDASGKEFIDDYIGNPSNNPNDTYKASGIFKTNVFTIDAQDLISQSDDVFWDNGIQAFDETELKNIATRENQSPYVSVGSDLLQVADYREDEDDTDWDYSLQIGEDRHYGKAYRTMLKVTKTGYYDFRIKVTYKKQLDSGESSANIVNYVQSIQVAIAPVTSPYFIKIFANDSFDTHGIKDGGSGPFITHDFSGTNGSGNQLLYIYAFSDLGGTLGLDDKVFDPATGGDPVSFNDIMQNYDVYNHVSGDIIDSRGLILDRNYVLYVKAKNP